MMLDILHALAVTTLCAMMSDRDALALQAEQDPPQPSTLRGRIVYIDRREGIVRVTTSTKPDRFVWMDSDQIALASTRYGREVVLQLLPCGEARFVEAS